jgi:arylsulfatase A-like enzyme
MLAWVDGVGDAPFFLTYLPVAGHHPYATGRPGPFQGDSELSAYRNALHEGDAALGALVDGLRSRGVQDKTLVVVYGDHGEAFGQHDGNFGHTMFIYDENVRVPLTFAIPGRPASVGRVANVASTVDIGPTILDLLGIPAVAAHEGVSLVDAASRLALFYTDYSLPLAGLQDGCWKYILQIDRGSSKLFDTCTDPDERRDLSTREPVRRDAYRQRVLAWVEARRAGMSGAPF